MAFEEKPHLCNAQHPNRDVLCALPAGHTGRCWVYVRANEAMHKRGQEHIEQKRREAAMKGGA